MAWGDYDSDGDLDLAVANVNQPNRLYRNDGGILALGAVWSSNEVDDTTSVAWGDYDNDGDLDLSVISYEGTTGAQVPHNALFRNDGAPGFVNVLSTDSPLNAGDHSAQFVDYNNDGAVDLSVTDGYGTVGGHFVFRNDMSEIAKKRSLSVVVLNAKGHHTVFGAEVRLFDQSGKVIATRQVMTGGGYNVQRAAPVHFGLAKIEPVRVEVTFMSASGPKKQSVNNVNPASYLGKSLVVRQR